MTASRASRPFRFGMVHSGPPQELPWGDYVRRVEGMGYGTLLMTDHLDGQYAVAPALAMAAAVSAELRIGSLVMCNDFYQPVLTAREAATLHRLSAGRFELGLGAGWDPRDYARVGVPYQPPGVRLARLAESLHIIRQCFTGQPFEHSGEHYQVRVDHEVLPPIEQPGPRILVGGGGPKALRLAGEFADIVSINPRLGVNSVTTGMINPVDPADVDRKVALVAEGAGDRFDDIELSVTVYAAIVTADADRAARLLGRRLGIDAERVLESPHMLVGSVGQIVDVLQWRRDRWGISYLVVDELVDQALAPVVEKLAGN